MPERVIDIPFPIGGLDRSLAYRSQPPLTTPDAVNVRPDSGDQRLRGGARPGLDKAYPQLLGSGGPVRMIKSVRTVLQEDLASSWSDPFDSGPVAEDLSGVWGEFGVPWIPTDAIHHKKNGEVFLTVFPGQPNRSAVRDELGGFDPTRSYTIDLHLISQGVAPAGVGYRNAVEIYFALDNNAPNWPQDGCMVRLTHNLSNGFGVILITNNAGVSQQINGSTGTSLIQPGHLIVEVDDLHVIVRWQGAIIFNAFVSQMPAGGRIAFRFAGSDPAEMAATSISVNYHSLIFTNQNKNILTASAGGLLYREDFEDPTQLVQTATNFTVNPLRSDAAIAAVERSSKLYIADYKTKATAGDGVIASGNQLTSASVPNFLTLPGGEVTRPQTDVVVLFAVGGATVEGTYAIASATASTLFLSPNPGDGTADFRIERAVKVYDPAQDELTILTATAGQVPQGNAVAALYRDRLVLAGAQHTPHAWYMSRQGDPQDWDYGAPEGDARRAVAGTIADAGEIAQPVRALIQYSDDFLIFAGFTQLWVLRGDPAFGAQVDNISYKVGCLGPNAWCHGPNGEVILLTHIGLYGLGPGAASFPQPLSERIPLEMFNVDAFNNDVSLVYDNLLRGVHVLVTPFDVNAPGQHFWFDWKAKGFWPTAYGGLLDPTAGFFYDADDPTRSAAILGGRNGFLYRHNPASGSDDGTPVSSSVTLGPFRAGEEFFDGIVQELYAVLGSSSANVDWAIYAGSSAEDAVISTTPQASGTWNRAGLNFKSYPRTRANAFIIKLTSTASDPWALERVTAGIKRAGRQRLIIA